MKSRNRKLTQRVRSSESGFVLLAKKPVNINKVTKTSNQREKPILLITQDIIYESCIVLGVAKSKTEEYCDNLCDWYNIYDKEQLKADIEDAYHSQEITN